MPAEAFRTFAVDAPYAAQTIKKYLIERKQQLTAELAMSRDWPDHKYRVGMIHGIDDAINACIDMERKERE